ncbi:hypothetical protein KEM52_001572, partial [Ascosphaera acerosa]
VVYTLAALQSAVADLQRAYVTHADTVLSMGGVKASTSASLLTAPALPLNLSVAGVLEAGLAAQASGLAGGAATATAPAPAPASDSEEAAAAGGKAKRKRRKHDPNAPKRPLTPYFLFMQQNRMKIAGELPAGKRPQDVSNEGTRRWQEMSEDERAVYTQQYLQNLEVYRVKMEAYKAGRAVPDDAAIAADLQLQKDVERDAAAAAASAIDAAKGKAKGGKAEAAASDESSSDDSEDESEDSSGSASSSSSESEAEAEAEAEAAPAPKKRKRAAKEEKATAVAATPAVAAGKEKKEKKERKTAGSVTRSAKKDAEAVLTTPAETPSRTPKADKPVRKRKRKSEAAAQE